MNNKPFVIFIDGVDGCGKTTLTNKLLEKLPLAFPNAKVKKFEIMQSTEPGKLIREAMITEEINETLRYTGFMFGVFYGLEKLYENTDHDFIICDRSQATPYAYNICAPNNNSLIKNAQVAIFDDLNNRFFDKRMGSFINVHLQLDSKIAYERMGERTLDVIEARGPAFQDAVELGFKSYFNKHSQRGTYLPINTASITPDVVTDSVIQNLIFKNALRITKQS